MHAVAIRKSLIAAFVAVTSAGLPLTLAALALAEPVLAEAAQEAPASAPTVTYAKQISRLMQEKCQGCHREGDIAPFSLTNYETTMEWAEDIQRVVSSRQMPPWKPVAGHGDFKDNFGLTDEQRTMLLDWFKNGAPMGDPAELPDPLPARTSDWQLGEPDKVVQMPVLYNVPRRKDTYRCFVLPSGLTEDAYLKAIDIIPGNRQVVHHVILYLDTTTASERLDAQDEEPGYECFGGPGRGVPLSLGSFIGGWVPGVRPSRLPEGIGTLIPKNSRLILQMHYFPAGRTAEDQTKVGLYFAKSTEKMERRLAFLPIVDQRFQIPPGEKEYSTVATFPVLPFLDMKAYVVVPHMHLLGRKITLERVSPDRTRQSLILIDDWDFNWQGFFYYQEPVPIRSGQQIRLTCTFDNSADNPRNPSNPLKTVTWGEGTEDEMCIAFLGVTFDFERLIPFDLTFIKRRGSR